MKPVTNLPNHAGFNRSYVLRVVADKGEPTIEHILVVREKSEATWYGAAGGLRECELTISYDVFLHGSSRKYGPCSMRANYNANTHIIDLTCGGLFLDPEELRGKSVGTFLFYRIVEWAKTWPSADVAPIGLVSLQAGPTNKERRNQFYEQFGVKFDFKDESKEEGTSKPITAQNLNLSSVSGAWTSSVREVSFVEHVDENLRQSKDIEFELIRAGFTAKNLQDRLNVINAHPLRYALLQAYQKYSYLLVPTALIVIVCCFLAIR